jgi:hypothetical protein
MLMGEATIFPVGIPFGRSRQGLPSVLARAAFLPNNQKSLPTRLNPARSILVENGPSQLSPASAERKTLAPHLVRDHHEFAVGDDSAVAVALVVEQLRGEPLPSFTEVVGSVEVSEGRILR